VEASEGTLAGADAGGVSVSADGQALSVAYRLRSSDPSRPYRILGLAGPGLRPDRSQPAVAPLATIGGEWQRVPFHARLSCHDASLAGASAASYGLVVQSASPLEALQTVPLGEGLPTLSTTVRRACLAQLIPALRVDYEVIRGQGGSPQSALELVVQNRSTVPLSVATVRRDAGDVQVDLSPVVPIPAGEAEVVSTRLLVQDCARPPTFPALASAPAPVRLDPHRDDAGIALSVALGDVSQVASYALDSPRAMLSREIAEGACTGTPAVRATVADAQLAPAGYGRWRADLALDLATDGTSIVVGTQQYEGPPWGGGSVVTTDTVEPATGWVPTTARVDSASGRLRLVVMLPACRDPLTRTTVGLLVTGRRGQTYPFQAPIDLSEVRARACPA
jgi:hypothetical protein